MLPTIGFWRGFRQTSFTHFFGSDLLQKLTRVSFHPSNFVSIHCGCLRLSLTRPFQLLLVIEIQNLGANPLHPQSVVANQDFLFNGDRTFETKKEHHSCCPHCLSRSIARDVHEASAAPSWNVQSAHESTKTESWTIFFPRIG